MKTTLKQLKKGDRFIFASKHWEVLEDTKHFKALSSDEELQLWSLPYNLQGIEVELIK